MQYTHIVIEKIEICHIILDYKFILYTKVINKVTW